MLRTYKYHPEKYAEKRDSLTSQGSPRIEFTKVDIDEAHGMLYELVRNDQNADETREDTEKRNRRLKSTAIPLMAFRIGDVTNSMKDLDKQQAFLDQAFDAQGSGHLAKIRGGDALRNVTIQIREATLLAASTLLAREALDLKDDITNAELNEREETLARGALKLLKKSVQTINLELGEEARKNRTAIFR